VSISSSLGVHTGRLENLQRLDVIFVEEVAKIGRHGDIKYFGFMRSLQAERPSRAPRTLSDFLVRHVPAVASCGNAFFHRTTNAAGKIEPGNWPVVQSDFPGYICSLMEKRVPTKTIWEAVGSWFPALRMRFFARALRTLDSHGSGLTWL
jgi:hypothetical protein